MVGSPPQLISQLALHDLNPREELMLGTFDYSTSVLSCEHHPLYYLGWERQEVFCGLCSVKFRLELEVPGRVHAYKLLADNGNPATDPRMWAHLEAALGLIPPKPQQNLNEYRLARERLYGKPSKRLFPTTRALWDLMGYQPKLATPLVRTIFGKDVLQVAAELGMTRYGVHMAIAKGVRTTLRYVRAS